MIKKKELKILLEWALVSVVSGFMMIYGVSKYMQFDDFKSYTEPLKSYPGMRIMWAFYSYSKAYSILLGIFEILGALLFLLPKTRIIGGLLLTTILTNIILQDVFYEVHIGALLYAIFFQLIILIVFYIHRNQLKIAFKDLRLNYNFKKTDISIKKILTYIFLVVSLIASMSAAIYLINIILK